MDELKYCKFCDKEKPIKDFCKSGFAIKNICKECNNKKQTQIYRNSKKVEQLQQENKQLKDKIPYIIQNNACRYISIEKCKNKVCVNYEIQELEGSDSNVKNKR